MHFIFSLSAVIATGIFTVGLIQAGGDNKSNNNDKNVKNEQTLAEYVRQHYPAKDCCDKTGLPNNDVKEPIKVTFTLLLNEILNHADSTVTFGVTLLLKWHDDNIKWSRKQWGGIDVINLPATCIWHPDVFVYDEFLSRYHVQKKDENSLAPWVYYNGDIVWSPPNAFRVQCLKDTLNQNHVKKNCTLRFVAGPYEQNRLNFDFGPESGNPPNWNVDFYTPFAFPGINIKQSSAVRVDFPFIAPKPNAHFWLLSYNIDLKIDLTVNEPVEV